MFSIKSCPPNAFSHRILDEHKDVIISKNNFERNTITVYEEDDQNQSQFTIKYDNKDLYYNENSAGYA